jgi:translation initiation factor IF-1
MIKYVSLVDTEICTLHWTLLEPTCHNSHNVIRHLSLFHTISASTSANTIWPIYLWYGLSGGLISDGFVIVIPESELDESCLSFVWNWQKQRIAEFIFILRLRSLIRERNCWSLANTWVRPGDLVGQCLSLANTWVRPGDLVGQCLSLANTSVRPGDLMGQCCSSF